jgi:hypothetical protein
VVLVLEFVAELGHSPRAFVLHEALPCPCAVLLLQNIPLGDLQDALNGQRPHCTLRQSRVVGCALSGSPNWNGEPSSAFGVVSFLSACESHRFGIGQWVVMVGSRSAPLGAGPFSERPPGCLIPAVEDCFASELGLSVPYHHQAVRSLSHSGPADFGETGPLAGTRNDPPKGAESSRDLNLWCLLVMHAAHYQR